MRKLHILKFSFKKKVKKQAILRKSLKKQANINRKTCKTSKKQVNRLTLNLAIVCKPLLCQSPSVLVITSNINKGATMPSDSYNRCGFLKEEYAYTNW